MTNRNVINIRKIIFIIMLLMVTSNELDEVGKIQSGKCKRGKYVHWWGCCGG